MFNAKKEKKNENRNVILFLDNPTCRPKATLSNVKIAWLPTNATSVLQPMDMGVIYIFKSHYRRFLMQSLISNVEEAELLCISKICISSGCCELDQVGSEEN
jgi:hypothetical protein